MVTQGANARNTARCIVSIIDPNGLFMIEKMTHTAEHDFPFINKPSRRFKSSQKWLERWDDSDPIATENALFRNTSTFYFSREV